jgi:Ca2+:H+ antiporter
MRPLRTRSTSQQMVVGPNRPNSYIPLPLRPLMNLLLKEIRHNPLFWLLAFVPVVFVAHKVKSEAHTLLFALSVLAIVPLARATEPCHRIRGGQDGRYRRWSAQRHTGELDRIGHRAGALRAGRYTLVKAAIAGAIVTNTPFMLGVSFLLGGLKHHVQEYNRASARRKRTCSFWPRSQCWFLRRSL